MFLRCEITNETGAKISSIISIIILIIKDNLIEIDLDCIIQIVTNRIELDQIVS